mmetsp:Transcript_16313/g.28556  ORF Transcript_16313/g.28556 Transcript_16313/m.28556 type:complete len:1878 (-) Transcript_16313:150-5783(-)|eukprot:CAMPEP_0197641244 /NCGR_PEP_ID=MMETSP1338-20131121/15264_1 /TAXON_ID=43686 ORGANISM="Pelagodinium beii, Strain RCC1491" /NCGR_SAMPLE_ID=MMETSP1338 /ASSEMBLY_ACC=CAM_ASM_000754 /LENGTH=1877 /DNA_ID=CAMNT_0043214191 /DNA_START=16 /DNA_END=5649 /DNA_ORIENTATION=+
MAEHEPATPKRKRPAKGTSELLATPEKLPRRRLRLLSEVEAKVPAAELTKKPAPAAEPTEEPEDVRASEEEPLQATPKRRGRPVGSRDRSRSVKPEPKSKQKQPVLDGPIDADESQGRKGKITTRRPPPPPYRHPAGKLPQDVGVEAVVRLQVSKVLQLLKETKAAGDWKSLRIGTACSGTDSPVLGAKLSQEALREANLDYSFEHVMSCEIEPFKQAFIARNYPQANLFPDIRKLAPEDGSIYAQNVVGNRMKVPELDIFIAGTVCKDFSMRKAQHRKDLEDKGNSGQTFFAAVDFIFTRHIQFSIFENVSNAPWAKMQEYITGVVLLATMTDDKGGSKKVSSKANKEAVAENDTEMLFLVLARGELEVIVVPRLAGVRVGSKLIQVRDKNGKTRSARLPTSSHTAKGQEVTLTEVRRFLQLLDSDSLVFDTAKKGFLCRKISVDSKDYGLPQTRNRGYMLVWHESQGGQELGELWAELVKHMEQPLQSSLDEFLLPDDDERVRRLREVLRGPLGRKAQEDNAMSWNGDWWSSESKDAERQKKYRDEMQVSSNHLLLTGWGKHGARKGQPSLWPELLGVLSSRQCDMMEIFAAECSAETTSVRGGRQSEAICCPRDPLHSSLVWDISQNVGIACSYNSPGVTGCITPGGWLLLPNRGRCMLGYEKLICQGIPPGRLALGMESEVQLSDLAGNAMSLPVVNSCLLATLVVKALGRKRKSQPGYRLDSAHLPLKPRINMQIPRTVQVISDTNAAFRALASLSARAEAASILCNCESSGSITMSQILQCRGCGLSLCRDCAVKVAHDSHDLMERILSERPESPSSFERELRSLAPQRLLLQSVAMTLVLVKRDVGQWLLRYLPEVQDPEGASELKIFIGRSRRPGGFTGLRAELRLLKADAKNTAEESVRVAGRLQLKAGQSEAIWQMQADPQSVMLEVQGFEQHPSYRAEMGLKQYANEMWPDKLQINSAQAEGLTGIFERMKCKGTAVLNALYRNAGTGMYLFFVPDVNRTGPDVPVLASSPSYAEAASFSLATLHPKWTPNSISKTTSAVVQKWTPAPDFKLQVLPERVTVGPVSSLATLGSSPHDTLKLMQLSFSDVDMESLGLCGTDWKKLSKASLQSFQRLGTEVVVAMSRHGVPAAARDWQALPAADWGRCKVSAPLPPLEQWQDGTRCYNHEESVDFDLALKSRPEAWQLRVRAPPTGAEADISVRPVAVAHRAAAAFKLQDTDNVTCDWRVAEQSTELEQFPGRFMVPNSDRHVAAQTPRAFKPEKKLYARQARALRRMLDVEAGLVSFVEEERSEHQLDGLGWFMEARARVSRILPGGVLADEMGGGKTVTSLALIASDQSQTHLDQSLYRNVPELQRSRATLVLCPPSLVNQWDDERKQFTGDGLSTLTIRTVEDLAKITAEMLCNADMVIASCELLVEEKYRKILEKRSGKLLPQCPGEAGHKEPEQLQGIWIPGHPAAPYAQAKGKQKAREQTAYFSHCYCQAVEALRKKNLSAEETNCPLEAFLWKRIIADEVHQVLAPDKNKQGEQLQKKTPFSAREMLGVTQPEVHLRPLRASRGVWGLTGTPMLSDEQRVTEMAAFCGGIYVMSARSHWRALEKASQRDEFLLAQEPASSTQYRMECRRHAQLYVQAAFQRNKNGDDLKTKKIDHEEKARFSQADDITYRASMPPDVQAGHAPDRMSLSPPVWQKLMQILASSSARIKALQSLIERVHKENSQTKIVVFAPEGAGMDAARRALQQLASRSSRRNFFTQIGEPGQDAFAREDVLASDAQTARILLLSYDEAAGLNLQYSCNHVVLFAPLDFDDDVAACAQEQQAIGRVHRPGQKKDVHAYRIVVQGARGEETLDGRLVRRNTSSYLIQQATSC